MDGYTVSKGRPFCWMLRITLRECKCEVDIPSNRIMQIFIKTAISKSLSK
jgi:hypothetical protein